MAAFFSDRPHVIGKARDDELFHLVKRARRVFVGRWQASGHNVFMADTRSADGVVQFIHSLTLGELRWHTLGPKATTHVIRGVPRVVAASPAAIRRRTKYVWLLTDDGVLRALDVDQRRVLVSHARVENAAHVTCIATMDDDRLVWLADGMVYTCALNVPALQSKGTPNTDAQRKTTTTLEQTVDTAAVVEAWKCYSSDKKVFVCRSDRVYISRGKEVVILQRSATCDVPQSTLDRFPAKEGDPWRIVGVLSKHSAHVTSITFADDGCLITATQATTGEIRVYSRWSPQRGHRQIAYWLAHRAPVVWIATRRRIVVSHSLDNTLRIFNYRTRRQLQAFKKCTYVAATWHGSRLLCMEETGFVRELTRFDEFDAWQNWTPHIVTLLLCRQAESAPAYLRDTPKDLMKYLAFLIWCRPWPAYDS